MQYDGNEPFIFGDKNLDFDGIKSLDTTAPFVSDKLELLKHQIWNEAMTFLGIDNINQDKKERMVASETLGNLGNVEAQRNVMLNSRRQAVDKINAMFGTNIEVDYRQNIKPVISDSYTIKENIEEGVEENE